MSERLKVVVDRDCQYSIWPADRENPQGWKSTGKEGSRQECTDYIEEVWTDMRPLSLKQRTEKLRSMEERIKREGG